MKRLVIIAAALGCLISCQMPSSRAGGGETRTVPQGAVREGKPLASYADVVDAVAPAVVTIRASKRVRAPQQFPFFDDPLFRQFFGGGVPRSRGGDSEVQHALGSGVIVRDDGYLLTNHHVI